MATPDYVTDLVNKAPVLAFAKDLEGRYVFVNEAWLHFCRLTPEQVLGKSDAQLFPPEFADEFVKNDRLVAETGQTIQVEEHGPTEGPPMVAVSTKFPLRDSAGNVVAVGGIAVDITDKHQAQLDLAASENRYRALLEHSPEAFLVFNVRTGFFVEANENAQRLFGISREDFCRASPADLSPPTQPDGRTSEEAAAAYIGAALQGQFPVFEWVHQGSNGQLLPCRIWLARYELPDGPGVRASILDMREIVSMRSVLEHTKAQLDAVQDALPQVVVVYEPTTHTVAHTNRTYQDLAPAVPIWSACEEGCRLAQQNGTARQEVVLKTGAGKARTFQVDVSVFGRASSGSPLRLLIVGTDITEQRKLDAKLRESGRLESLGRLAGGVAHDFNNLLTVILGSTEFLETRILDDEEAKADLEMLLSATKKAQQITAQLLTFARSTRGHEEFLVVDDLVSESLPLLQRVLGEEVTTVVNLDAESARVWIDRGQFEQILMNLTANARDAMRPGDKLTIATRCVESLDEAQTEPSGTFVELRFEDNGAGMSQETIEKAFEPFFTTKGVGRGTGLGLSTVHGIVKSADGKISITSTPGTGSTVTIWLPVAKSAPSELSSGRSSGHFPVSKSLSNDEAESFAVPLSILLVEDNPAVLDVNRRALTNAGHQVTVATDGEMALGIVQKEAPFDVIVTDVVMPAITGFELAERVRAALPLQRFVFVSGYAEDALKERGLNPEDVEILQKPFSPNVLVQHVETVTRG